MTSHEQYADDLALYALDALDSPEKAVLEQHLAGCAECRRELEALRGTVAMVAMSSEQRRPSAAARRRFIAALKPEAAPRRSFSLPWLLAPVAAALVLAVALVVQWQQNRSLERDLATLRDASAARNAPDEQAATLVRLLNDRNALRFTLTATGARPQPQVEAIYAPQDRSLVLIAAHLPPVPREKAYQLWLLPQSGAPIPSGTFLPQANGRVAAVMPPAPQSVQLKGFAVTVEPSGGSSTPTMPIVYLGS